MAIKAQCKLKKKIISFCVFPRRAFINYETTEQNKLSILSVANIRMYTLRFAFPVD